MISPSSWLDQVPTGWPLGSMCSRQWIHRWKGIGPPNSTTGVLPNQELLHWIVTRSCCGSVAQWCPTLCNLGFAVLHYLPEFVQAHIHWVSDAIQPFILCLPLLLLPSIFPSIRDFSSESALPIRWPKYWSFSFSISPFSEYSGLTSFRADWFDSLQSKGFSWVFSGTIQRHQFFGIQPSLWSNSHIHTWLLEKP